MKFIPILFTALLLIMSTSAFRFKAKTDSTLIDGDMILNALANMNNPYISKHFLSFFLFMQA